MEPNFPGIPIKLIGTGLKKSGSIGSQKKGKTVCFLGKSVFKKIEKSWLLLPIGEGAIWLLSPIDNGAKFSWNTYQAYRDWSKKNLAPSGAKKI